MVWKYPPGLQIAQGWRLMVEHMEACATQSVLSGISPPQCTYNIPKSMEKMTTQSENQTLPIVKDQTPVKTKIDARMIMVPSDAKPLLVDATAFPDPAS